MKQVLQHLRTGALDVDDVPAPGVSPGSVLLRSSVSLISSGTERSLLEFGRGNWLSKLRQQPDKVRQVWDKLRTDGLRATVEAVRSKLDQPMPLGYCNVGRVVEVGRDVTGFAAGDRVVSNGRHAEIVCVPRHLCARIPSAVDDDSAAFTVLAAIALNGVRLVQPTLGEAVVVTGLGVVGLLTVQLLRANGCRVLGIDKDAQRVDLARRFGADAINLSAGEDPLAAAREFSRGRGVDAVLITASTRSSEPIAQAAQMCRKRGRLVLVGVTGLELSRADFYEKELTFQVSCSYGPGRYDPGYEEQGHDYPLGYVRWTEQRNFEAVLDLMAAGRLDLAPLITHRYAIDAAKEAYDLLVSDASPLGILIGYPSEPAPEAKSPRQVRLSRVEPTASPALGIVGAGNYSSRVLLPAFRAAGASLHTVVSANGLSALHCARKFGAGAASTDVAAMLADRAVDAVVIATRHDSHARLVCEAIAAGKHVFVEKPLCLTAAELDAIDEVLAASASPPLLMVGFNRRFSPLVVRMKSLLGRMHEPKTMVMSVNAGMLPPGHWTQDPAIGGGRLLGEGCHFIDLLRHLAGVPIAGVERTLLRSAGGPPRPDNATVVMRFEDGSVGTLHYFANGHPGFPKERLDVFCAGRVLQLDNFRRLRGWGWPGFARAGLWRQDKGQAACAAAFVQALRDGSAAPIALDEIREVSRIAIGLAEPG